MSASRAGEAGHISRCIFFLHQNSACHTSIITSAKVYVRLLAVVNICFSWFEWIWWWASRKGGTVVPRNQFHCWIWLLIFPCGINLLRIYLEFLTSKGKEWNWGLIIGFRELAFWHIFLLRILNSNNCWESLQHDAGG